jgi:hypothetical protein
VSAFPLDNARPRRARSRRRGLVPFADPWGAEKRGIVLTPPAGPRPNERGRRPRRVSLRRASPFAFGFENGVRCILQIAVTAWFVGGGAFGIVRTAAGVLYFERQIPPGGGEVGRLP